MVSPVKSLSERVLEIDNSIVKYCSEHAKHPDQNTRNLISSAAYAFASLEKSFGLDLSLSPYTRGPGHTSLQSGTNGYVSTRNSCELSTGVHVTVSNGIICYANICANEKFDDDLLEAILGASSNGSVIGSVGMRKNSLGDFGSDLDFTMPYAVPRETIDSAIAQFVLFDRLHDPNFDPSAVIVRFRALTAQGILSALETYSHKVKIDEQHS
jgi:hypothetical protein